MVTGINTHILSKNDLQNKLLKSLQRLLYNFHCFSITFQLDNKTIKSIIYNHLTTNIKIIFGSVIIISFLKSNIKNFIKTVFSYLQNNLI